MAMTDNANTKGANSWLATGNIGNEKSRKPYPPIFRKTPARITEPAVGASTCASGSQVCTGHIGTLTANEAKNASHSQRCRYSGNCGLLRIAAISVVGGSVLK